MFQNKIKRTTVTISNTVGSYGADLADKLGLNYDSETDIMYAGDDPSTGIIFAKSGTPIYAYLIAYGSSTTSNTYSTTINPTSGSYQNRLDGGTTYDLYYIKTDNALIFGLNGTGNTGAYTKFQIAVVKGYDSNGDERYIWVSGTGTTAQYKYIWTEYSTKYLDWKGGVINSLTGLSLSPIAIDVEADNIVTSDYLFFASTAYLQTNTMGFTFNNEEYVLLSGSTADGINENYARAVIKLE